MDFPPMDWGSFFAFSPAAVDPPLPDHAMSQVAENPNGLEEIPGSHHLDTLQPSDPDINPKLGVCSSCRKKKRRCNLERPSCSLCRINNWACEYRHVKKKPGPPRNSFVRRSARSSREDHVEGLVTSHTDAVALTNSVCSTQDAVESTDWDAQLRKVSFVEDPATDDVEINSSLSSVNLDLAVRNLVSPEIGLDISQNTKAILTSLYFDNVQPIFPLFRRAAFEADLMSNNVSEALLYMMFALASRYVPATELLRVFGPRLAEPWEYFARMGFKKSRFNDENDSDAPMSLEDVKTSFLLTLHEYTSFPGRRAWMRVGNTVRVAIAAGLHRLDQPGKHNALAIPEEEREEWRQTWWAVWRVDSSINVLAGSPFNIQTCDIYTALPSSSTADFTAGRISSSKGDLLPADVIQPWRSAQDIQSAVSKESPNFYFQTVSYNREAAICRRRLDANPTPELMGQFINLKQVLPYLKVALPPSVFSGVKQPSEEGVDKHRQRIETLILLQITEVVLHLPIRENGFDDANPRQQKRLADDWQSCIDTIEDISALLRHWEPYYSRLTDPMISCVIWLSSSILVLHTMSTYYQQGKRPGDSDSIQDSLQVLITSLEGFSRYWPIARLLLKSLQSLRSWNWLSLSFQDVLCVASQLQSPIDPQVQNPATINVWPVFANSNEDFFEDHMILK